MDVPVTETKENGSLIGSSVSESEASSNDFRAIDDILPNEPFEDEGESIFYGDLMLRNETFPRFSIQHVIRALDFKNA